MLHTPNALTSVTLMSPHKLMPHVATTQASPQVHSPEFRCLSLSTGLWPHMCSLPPPRAGLCSRAASGLGAAVHVLGCQQVHRVLLAGSGHRCAHSGCKCHIPICLRNTPLPHMRTDGVLNLPSETPRGYAVLSPCGDTVQVLGAL